MKDMIDVIRSLHWSRVLMSLAFAWPAMSLFVWMHPDDVQTLRLILMPMLEGVRLEQYAPIYPIVTRMLCVGSTYVLAAGLVAQFWPDYASERSRAVQMGLSLGIGYWVMVLYGISLGFFSLEESIDAILSIFSLGPAMVLFLFVYAVWDLTFGKIIRRYSRDHWD